MQKRGDLQGLVKGLFLTGKKFLPVGLSPRTINREPFRPTGQTGAPVYRFTFSADLIGQFGGLPSGNLPPTSTLKIKYLGTHRDSCGSLPSAASEGA